MCTCNLFFNIQFPTRAHKFPVIAACMLVYFFQPCRSQGEGAGVCRPLDWSCTTIGTTGYFSSDYDYEIPFLGGGEARHMLTSSHTDEKKS